MSRSVTASTTVVGKFADTDEMLLEFWRYMREHAGGRTAPPESYTTILDISKDKGGYVVHYQADIEDEPIVAGKLTASEMKLLGAPASTDFKPMEPPPKSNYSKPTKCHVASCTAKPVEGKIFCADHQTSESRRAAAVAAEKRPPACKHSDCVSIGKKQCYVTGNEVCHSYWNGTPVAAERPAEQDAQIPLADIQISGWNPRKHFDETKISELAADIEANGLIQPILVRPKGATKYELVVGERRLRAHRLIKRETIPARVRELTDEQVLVIMLSENENREPLNPIEEAHHLKRVLEVGKLTQTELARRLNKSQNWVSDRLKLAELPADVQGMIIRRLIFPNTAIELMRMKDHPHFGAIKERVQREISDEGEITVSALRAIIDDETAEPAPTVAPPEAKDEERSMDDIEGDWVEKCVEEDEKKAAKEVTQVARPSFPTDPALISLAAQPQPERRIGFPALVCTGAVEASEKESVESKASEPKAYTCTDGCQPRPKGKTVTHCRCGCDAKWPTFNDEVEEIVNCLRHLYGEQGVGDEEHAKALRRVGTCIRSGGNTWHLLNKLFAKGVN